MIARHFTCSIRETIGMRKQTGPLLQKLRAVMRKNKFLQEPLEAYIVPQKDPHDSEFLAPRYERRAFISGFTGSAGTAVVTQSAACLWTDGRYFLEATAEMDENWTLMKSGVPGTPRLEVWLTQELPEGSRVGIDPTLVSVGDWRTWSTELRNRQHVLVPVAANLIDEIWDQRPPASDAPLIVHPLTFSGKKSGEKITEVRKKMEDKNTSLLVISELDEVAWLLNLRGSDFPYNPVFFAYVVISAEDVILFVDTHKITPEIEDHFSKEDIRVAVQPYTNIVSFLENLVDKGRSSEKYWIPHLTNYAVASTFPEDSRISDISPVALMKAMKNPTEVKGMMDCHVRDGAALVCYLSWLEKQLAAGETVTEISGAAKLESFRKEQEHYVGLVYPAMSASGLHGAVIHYLPSKGTDKLITLDEMYLIDSGGQFKDGSTDITRTLHFGTPTEYQKECFTRVFKGHVTLATVNFPIKTVGNRLDTLARHSLWSVGLDYGHNTGHGIGSFLYVHESWPLMGIGKYPRPDDPGLHEAMFLSNEPGYYEEGQFGIRIENVQMVIPTKTKYQKNDFFTFEVVSMAPIQTKMLEPKLLTKEEIDWLNRYHSKVREKLTPLLLKLGHNEAADWLRKETEPIS